MAKFFDSGYDILMTRITRDDTGAEVFGDEKDIEVAFGGLVYKSFDGLDSFGKPRPYVETFAERDDAAVYVDPKDSRDQTELKLTLYFFDKDRHESAADSIAAAEAVYRDFMAFVSGCELLYRDTARKRKVRMYLKDSTAPKTDRLYGQVYKEVVFTFANVYGRSFGYDEDF